MKIVCLIKPSPPTIYFVNKIHRHHPVSLVVVEQNTAGGKSKLARMRSIVNEYGWLFLLGLLLERTKPTNRDATYNKLFGDQWHDLDPAIPAIQVTNINDQACVDRLQVERADLLLDHGTSIVKAPALDTAPLALNLHWGLSPYYRGTNCTGWALANWDPYNIGVTVHKLAKRIDGGDILSQARASITATDDAHSIDMQLTQLGTEIMVRAIGLLETGEDLEFHPQDFSKGFVTLSRQVSHHWLKHVRLLERRGLARMLTTPARAERLPIVET